MRPLTPFQRTWLFLPHDPEHIEEKQLHPHYNIYAKREDKENPQKPKRKYAYWHYKAKRRRNNTISL